MKQLSLGWGSVQNREQAQPFRRRPGPEDSTQPAPGQRALLRKAEALYPMAVASIASWVEGIALAGHPAVCFSVCLAVVCLPPISSFCHPGFPSCSGVV